MSISHLSALQSFLKQHPHIKYTPPSSPDYPSERKVWNIDRVDVPLAIVHPQSAEDVSTLVKYAKSAGLRFTIRVGGHDLQGRSIAEGALVIDLRALRSVNVAAHRKSATVDEGILQSELATKLWEEGLGTPTGVIPSVGYVGWAMFGGYGPFSTHWGLGVDQIIGATIVNPEGVIVTTDQSLLKGIRGAGGLFGVIVNVTIKLYPLNSLLAGVIMYNSRDISKTFVEFNTAYQTLLDDGLPLELPIQQIAFNPPTGRAFGVIFVWSGDDIEEGQRWKEKIASLSSVVMNTVAVTTIPDWFSTNAALVASSVHGSSGTHTLRLITSEVSASIGRSLEEMPSDPVTMFTIHQLRGPSAAPDNNSVFAMGEPHFMLEIMGCVTREENRQEAKQWISHTSKNIQQTDSSNILPNVYISLYPGSEEPAGLSKFFGSHVEEIIALKEKFDPENVFSLTVPKA